MITRFSLFLSLAFTLVFVMGGCGQAAPKLDKSVTVDCSYFAGWTEIEAFLEQTSCGYLDAEGVVHISAETMRHFDSEEFKSGRDGWHPKGLSCLTLSISDGSKGFAYISKDGRARLSNFPYDNSCQPFRNDVAISYVDGKAVFFDANLNVVKQTDFVLADPFYKDIAKVCIEMPNKAFGPHNEHFEWKGGQCGSIDKNFKVVVPVEHAYEDAPRLTGGISLRDVPTLEFFLANLETDRNPVEAVFGVSGCKLNACTEELKEKLKIPSDLEEDKTWVTIMRFRLEDQTLWEGQAFYKNNRVLMLHSLEQIESLSAE